MKLSLIELTPNLLEDIRTRPDRIPCGREQYYRMIDEYMVKEIAESNWVWLRKQKAASPWTAYFAINEATREFVGTCSFKTQPGADREVAIVYFTFPPFEGQGVATEMVNGLCEICMGSEAVRILVAHTLPGKSAATRVLEKNDFLKTRTVDDPEEGQVWRWEKQL